MKPSNNKKSILRHLRIIVSNITGKSTVNGTRYTKELWDHILNDSSVQGLLKNKTLFGELDHPRDNEPIETSLKNSAVAFTDLAIEGEEVMGELDVLDTPAGRIVDSLINAGCNIGLSLRGEGNILMDGTVSPQGYKLHGIDVVSNPSYQSSRMIGQINESVKQKKPNTQVILESANHQIMDAKSVEDLATISSVVKCLPIKESEKDSMMSDINVRIKEYENGDTKELTDEQFNDAILESVLKEVNVLQKQVNTISKERDEFKQSYNDLITERLNESAIQERDNVLVSKQDLRELKQYAKVLESENKKLSRTLDHTVKEHSKYYEDKEKELVELKEEVSGLGVKVGGLDALQVENRKLKETVESIETKSDSLSTAYDELLKKYAKTKQSSTGIAVHESFKTAEEFDRIFESAQKQRMVLNSSRPKNSFHSVFVDDMNAVPQYNNQEEEQFAHLVSHFVPKEEK